MKKNDKQNRLPKGYTCNMQQVAIHAGVSKGTVSRVLKSDSRISEKTSERVRESIRRLGYKENALAASIFSGRTYDLGVVFPSIYYSFTSLIFQGVGDTAAKMGFSTVLAITGGEVERERQAIQKLIEKRVDGLIIYPHQQDIYNEHFVELIECEVPFVLIDRQIPGFDSNMIITNDFQGAYNAARHLIDLGHRQIVHLGGETWVSSAKERYRGFCAAMQDYGIAIQPHSAQYGLYNNPEFAFQQTLDLMREHPETTAIFAVSDINAIGAYRALKQLNLKVPDDVSVIGYADLDFCTYLETPLTTISQPKTLMGQRAVELVVEQIENGIQTKNNVVLETELVVRASTGRPRVTR